MAWFKELLMKFYLTDRPVADRKKQDRRKEERRWTGSEGDKPSSFGASRRKKDRRKKNRRG